jgi:hypothetical protein
MNIRVTTGNPNTRRSIEDAIERLLAMLDLMDEDPDLEPDSDDEHTLGWLKDGPQYCGMDNTDRELDDCDDEPEALEPCLTDARSDMEEGDDNGLADGDGASEQFAGMAYVRCPAI